MAKFLRAFDLLQSQAEPEAIDAVIRQNARFGGLNLWVLFFAILIASIGLNVNSTAVIIGAMLISPLMGPIIGIGYGAGIGDSRLIQSAARNLLWFMLISLATATAYFLLTPLEQAGSELLARTNPTIWDVLIAFFGGSAGIVANTRREASTAVPGVAIATALMPPLCTAGYGLANGNLDQFAGAFYLFAINSVFIAFSTWLFVRLLRLPRRADIAPDQVRRTRIWVAVVLVLTVTPSLVLTYRMLQQEVFVQTVNQLVSEAETRQELIVLGRRIDARARTIELTLGGERGATDPTAMLKDRLAAAGIGDARLLLRHAGSERIDLSTLRHELEHDIVDRLFADTERLRAEISRLEAALDSSDDLREERLGLMREIRVLFPTISALKAGLAHAIDDGDAGTRPPATILVLVLETADGQFAERERLQAWLAERLPGQEAQVLVVGPPAGEASAPRPAAGQSAAGATAG